MLGWMLRRTAAGVVLGLSLFAASLAWSGFVALRTVFDPARSRQVAEDIFEDPAVRSQLASNIADAMALIVPPGVDVDPAVLETAAQMVLNAPATRQVVAVALMQTHAAFLGEAPLPRAIDVGEVSQLARQALVQQEPRLDLVLPAAPDVIIELPTDRIPDISPLRTALRTLVPALAVIAAVGFAVALLTTTDRAGVVRRAGTWAISSSALVLVISYGVPWLISQLAPSQAEVLATLIAAVLGAARLPALVLGSVGLGAFGLSFAWSPGRATRTVHDGTQRDLAAAEPPAAATAGPDTAMVPAIPAQDPTTVPSAAGPVAVQPSAPPPVAPTNTDAPVDTGVLPASTPSPLASPRGAVPARPPQNIPLADPTQAAPATEAGAEMLGAGGQAVPPHGDGPPPKWVPGIGWVQHPDDARPPEGGRWEPGVGYILDRPDDPLREE